MKNKKVKSIAGVVIVLLLLMGPLSYSHGVISTELLWQDKYFAARVDLVPIIDAVLKENTVLAATVKELARGIEFRDGVIEDQQGQIEDQKDIIEDYRTRPPEVVEVPVEVIKEVPVEVIKEVPVEVIVEKIVEVPGPIQYIEIPAPIPTPLPRPVWPEEWDDHGDEDIDRPDPDPEPEPEPEPEPDPDPDCDKHKNKRGKGHHKGKHRR